MCFAPNPAKRSWHTVAPAPAIFCLPSHGIDRVFDCYEIINNTAQRNAPWRSSEPVLDSGTGSAALSAGQNHNSTSDGGIDFDQYAAAI
jgi:hypothetical protein